MISKRSVKHPASNLPGSCLTFLCAGLRYAMPVFFTVVGITKLLWSVVSDS